LAISAALSVGLNHEVHHAPGYTKFQQCVAELLGIPQFNISDPFSWTPTSALFW